MNHKINVRHFFDASHQLTDSPDLATKECARLHGHTYCVDVFDIKRCTPDDNGSGMVIDFKIIKSIVDILDHRHINDVFIKYGFHKQPTAENIAQFIYERIVNNYPLYVREVRIAEGYKGEDRASWAIYSV